MIDRNCFHPDILIYLSDVLTLTFCTGFTASANIPERMKYEIPTKVYNKYQGPKILAPFHLLLVFKNLDNFKV